MCSQRIGVAETAVQKHYECVTVVCELQRDMERYVADDRQERSLEAFYAELGPSAFTGLDMIAMDKLHPDIAAIRAVVPEADRELGFDKFRVARLRSITLDNVRATEHRALRAEGFNSRIRVIERRACGSRNHERFRHVTWLHLGGVDRSWGAGRLPTRFPEAPL